MVKVVIVNGKPGVGKTTFETQCDEIAWSKRFWANQNIHTQVISTVDFVKEVATLSGWNGEKTLENRKFLSDLKDLLARWNDVPYKKIRERILELEKSLDNYILFVDSREPAEIERFKNEFNAITLLIRRPGDEDVETSNHADANVFDYAYDYTVFNNESIAYLRAEAARFLEYMKGVEPYVSSN